MHRIVIKVQALADFLAAHSFLDITTIAEDESKFGKLDIWSIKVDGAVNSKGVGVRMIMTLLLGKYKGAQSIKLDSLLSNNQAKYEAFII